MKRASVKALLQLCEEESTKEAIVQQGGIKHLQVRAVYDNSYPVMNSQCCDEKGAWGVAAAHEDIIN